MRKPKAKAICVKCKQVFASKSHHPVKYCHDCNVAVNAERIKLFPKLTPALNMHLQKQSQNKKKTFNKKKQTCRICGNLKSEAHHDDYAKPYDVIWLCRKHHIIRHIHYMPHKLSHGNNNFI